jgi:predicted ABC-type ATPase
MPVLYILAGPNGTGKTTFYSIALQNGFIKTDLPFINVDMIARSTGGYADENYEQASLIYRNTVKARIDNNSDFMIESNLADSRSYEWVSLIKRKGYEIILYYLSTDDVLINIERVQRRVAEGGHDIAEAIIRSRYLQSHSYLKTKLMEFKEVYLIDNSTDASEIKFILKGGMVNYKAGNLPNWVKEITIHYERLHKK